MKNRFLLKVIILFFIILFSVLLLISINMVNKLKNEDTKKAIINDETPKSVKDVIIRSNSEYIKEEENAVYVKFAKKLYDNSQNSNESYFNNIIDKLKAFYPQKDFMLIDEEQEIQIEVIYEENKYKIIINGIDNYFEKGTEFQEIKYPEIQTMYTPNEYLQVLTAAGMSPKWIAKSLGEGKEQENGYTSYLEGKILTRTTNVNTIRNIVFTNKYEDEVVKNIKVKTPLSDIEKMYKNKTYGSVNEGYLGYYTDNYYYFFYDDEISVYPISYYENEEFEKILIEYLENKDLEIFINSIKNTLKDYDYFEYDPEIGKAHIMFSHKGYEIDIEENNSSGIILYSNYYLTDTTRELILKDKITFKEKENAVDKIEKERRRNR